MIYVTTKGGMIISNLANTPRNRELVLADASSQGALVTDTDSFYSASGRYYYLNPTAEAISGSLSGALDITNYVTGFNLNNRMSFHDVTVASNCITYTRYSNIQRLYVDTEGSKEASNAVLIKETNNYIADGDILIILGLSEDRKTKFVDSKVNSGADSTEAYGGTALTASDVGQIDLDSGTSFDTGDKTFVLMLIYSDTDKTWHELNRSPGGVITDDKIRDNSIPLPIKGAKVISTITGGDVTTPQAGITEGTIFVTGTHSIGSGNFTVDKPNGGTPVEGEKMTVVWNSNLTTSGAVNIFGQTLSTDQVANGTTKPMEITSHYVNGAWQDGVISRSDDASEDALGNPSSDGMVLSSTAAGVRSWVKRERAIHTVSATYDAASMAKAVSDTPVVISVDAFPKGALIMCDEAIIEMETALTSGGSADVSIGVNGGGISQDLDAIHNATDYNATPFSSATAVTRTSPGGSVTILKPASGSCNIEVNVTAADLTGGKFTVTVPYMTS